MITCKLNAWARQEFNGPWGPQQNQKNEIQKMISKLLLTSLHRRNCLRRAGRFQVWCTGLPWDSRSGQEVKNSHLLSLPHLLFPLRSWSHRPVLSRAQGMQQQLLSELTGDSCWEMPPGGCLSWPPLATLGISIKPQTWPSPWGTAVMGPM